MSQDNDFQQTIMQQQHRSPQQHQEQNNNNIPILKIIRLLYADDIASIGTAAKIKDLLTLCEEYSSEFGFRWNPLKFVLYKPSSASRIQRLKVLWPVACTILAELDAYQHPTSTQQQYQDENPGQALLTWIDHPPPPELTR
ncbi:hypothetical protein INT45_014002 [Circinella minor]|uniref:Uncharacterized protein n=1 Tax=Circinella minor TaxID=1195481 RepID=A0A8H7VLX7_9FUNG|nr:hypothetical protein INT45_014002 [Circinella minor]